MKKRKLGKQRKNALNLERSTKNLESTHKKQFVLLAIEMLKEGKGNLFIREYLKQNKTGSRSEDAIQTIIKEANAYITNDQFTKQQDILPLHLGRYNRQINRLMETQDADDTGEDVDAETYYKLRDKKAKAFFSTLDAVLQKEQLLQFHREDFEINITTEEEIEIKEETPSFSLEGLTFEEMRELYSLFKAARKTDFELAGIIQTGQTVSTEVTEDIQREVVETPNVELIKKIELPAPPKRSAVTAVDPTIKLREALQKKAAKVFDKIGTLTVDEKELLKNK